MVHSSPKLTLKRGVLALLLSGALLGGFLHLEQLATVLGGADAPRWVVVDGDSLGTTPVRIGPAARPPLRLAVPADHPLHDRFEGTSFANACSADGDCKKGGCSSEVCSAEEGVITTCDVPLISLPGDTECGCVEGQCQWWNASGDTLPPADTPPGTDCGGQPCAPPNECIEYYGIAGPSGPRPRASPIHTSRASR